MKLVLFGDSVFAGHGVAEADSIAARLQAMHPGWSIVVAGIPDETARDGLARIDGITGDIVLIEFGLNDAIEGVPSDETAATLRTIVDRLRACGSTTIVVEALVPSDSRWPARVDQAGMASGVAAATGSALVPDIIALAGSDRQADRLHPDAVGAVRIAETISSYLATVHYSDTDSR